MTVSESLEEAKIQRYSHLDVAKGLAIILVVLGHTSKNEAIIKFIYSFHMPFFFLVSGILMKDVKDYSFVFFSEKKFKTLLLPYFFFYLVSFIYWILIERNFRDTGDGVSAIVPFLGMFYGTDVGYLMLPNCPLWFLPCLFSVELIYFLIVKNSNNNIQRLLFAIVLTSISYGLTYFLLPRLPFGLNTALFVVVFYAVGHFYREFFVSFFKCKNLSFILLILVSFLVILQIDKFNGRVDLNQMVISNPILTLASGLIGAFMIIVLSYKIKTNNVLIYLGSNSLIIFAMSDPIKRVVIWIVAVIMKESPENVRYSIVSSIFITFVTILFTIPIVFTLNKYGTFLIGKRKVAN